MIKKLLIIAAAVIAAPAAAQDAPAAAPAAATLPPCSATVTDGCQQTARQEARAMTGAQVDKRDAAGMWTPNMRGAKAVTTTTTTATK